MAFKCTDRLLNSYEDGNYFAQQRWAGNYAVWFCAERLGVRNTLAEAQELVDETRALRSSYGSTTKQTKAPCPKAGAGG